MATTPNIGLHKPARTDLVSVVTDINNNMGTLDSKIGAVPAGHDVEEQITTLSDQIGTHLPGKIVVLTGTTAANGSDLELDYPTGASYSNTVIMSAQIEAAGAWRIIGLCTPTTDYLLDIRMTSTKIKVGTEVSNSAGKPFKLVLMIVGV